MELDKIVHERDDLEFVPVCMMFELMCFILMISHIFAGKIA